MSDETDEPRQVQRRAVLAAAAGILTSEPARGGRHRNSNHSLGQSQDYGHSGYGEGGYGDSGPPSPPGDVTGNGRVATDPDGDGRYEDVTGDGRFTVIDVVAFLEVFDDVPAEERAFFDFDSDGRLSIVDVGALLTEI